MWFLRLALVALAAAWIYHHALLPLASRILSRQADDLQARGRWEEAIEWLDRSLERDPTNCRALYIRAAVGFQQGRYRLAIDDYERLRRLHPDYVRVHFNQAVCHLMLEEYEEAVACWDRQVAIGGVPADLDLHRAITETRETIARRQRTEAGLEAILAGDPGNVLARIELGNIRYRQGDYAAAARHYEAVLDIWPGNIPAWNNLAGILFAGRDYAGALKAVDHIIARDPRAIEPRVNRIKALYMLRRFEEARMACDEVFSLDADNAEARSLEERLDRVGDG